MNVDSGISAELLHVVFAGAGALCTAIFTVVAGVVLSRIKRATRQRDERDKETAKAISDLRERTANLEGWRLGTHEAEAGRH